MSRARELGPARGLVGRVADHLERGGRRPDEIARFEGAELELLRGMCRGQRTRARVAAVEICELVGRVEADVSPGLGDLPMEGGASRPATPAPVAGPTEGDGTGKGLRSRWRDELAELGEGVIRVSALEDELASFGPLLGVGWHRAGTALSAVCHDRLGDLHAMLARAPELRAIADLFGRNRQNLVAGMASERGGRTTAVGVTMGGELADALASELALLATPETEDLFFMRYAERRLVSLEMTGEEGGEPSKPRPRRGPAIVLVDTSGSMIGRTAELGKALALAVIERLTAKGRAVEVVLFGGAGAMKSMVFGQGKTTADGLFDFLMVSFHGGTDFDGPLGYALERATTGRGLDRADGHQKSPSAMRERLKDADILIVTDGRARLSKAVKERVRVARRNGLALYAGYVDTGLGFSPRALLDLTDGIVTATPTGLVFAGEIR